MPEVRPRRGSSSLGPHRWLSRRKDSPGERAPGTGSAGSSYRLGVSLPDAPLKEFLARTTSIPRTTEAERLVVQRVGQDVFRRALIEYWKGCCPLTGITDPALLRASHIVPWAECETDALRLDVHNGLLLSALWDAAFYAGLASFDDAGKPLLSPTITEAAAEKLNPKSVQQPNLTDAHRANLTRHRAKHGYLERMD
jgi:hypothetical protein